MSEREANQQRALVRKVWAMLTGVERRGVLVLIGLVTGGIFLETLGLSLVVPAIMVITKEDIGQSYPAVQPFLDALGNPSQQTLIVWGLLLLLGVYLVKSLYLAWLALHQTRFLFNVRVRVSEQLYSTYLAQPWTFHLQRNSSQLIRNMLTETNQLIQSAIGPLMRLVSESLLMLCLLAVLLLAEPVGAITAALVLGLAASVFYAAVRRPLKVWGTVRQRHEGLRIQQLQQGMNGVKEVKLLGREDEFIANYQHHNRETTRVVRNQNVMNQMPRLWLEFLAVVGLTVLVGTMLARGRSPDAVLPTLALFAAVTFRIMPSANKLVSALQQLRYGSVAVENLYDELQLRKTEPAGAETTATLPLRRQIQFNQVSFSYPASERRALSDVSLRIRKGESIGLIGQSGSGKSTLADLLLGILTPDRGEILVDGVNIQSNLRAWQRQLGYIPQFIYLTDDTLIRNVAFGVPDDHIDVAAVERALAAAQLDTLVATLPEGMQTIVGEQGVRLSGGQRQRIGIARALYHDPEVLVLDEATSALDNETEAGVMEAIAALHGEKTIVIVAHRLSTVACCDRIYRLHEGRVVEEGPAHAILRPGIPAMTEKPAASG